MRFRVCFADLGKLGQIPLVFFQEILRARGFVGNQIDVVEIHFGIENPIMEHGVAELLLSDGFREEALDSILDEGCF